MLSKEVKQWLTDCKSVSSSDEGSTFTCELADQDLILGLFELLDTPPFHSQELDPVCHQLYEFYRSKDKSLKQFSLQFAPALVWLYLSCLSQGDKKVCGGVETFLLGVYNLEIVGADGSPVVETFCIPSINKTSAYHESRSWLAESLTERALHSLSHQNAELKRGPFPQFEKFNSQNRFPILTYVLQHYNSNVDSFHSHSLEVLCKVAIKLSSTGYSTLHESGDNTHPRISVSQSVLLELLYAVHYALFNGHHEIAVEAVKAVHKRSSYELYSEVLLVTSAILNSNSLGNFHFETTDINYGALKTAQVVKNSVTNASFKAKKLPDDIDVVEEVQRRLPAISEDQEYPTTKGRKSKLMNFGGKLGLDKIRNRDVGKQQQNSDSSSPKYNSKAEFVDAVCMSLHNQSAAVGGKGVADATEMQQIRSKGNGSRLDKGGDNSNGDSTSSNGKTNKDGKQIKASSSTIVFSKKSGILRQLSHGASGLVTKISESTTKTSSHSITSSPSSSASSQPQTASASVTTVSVNGNPSGSNNSPSSNVTNSFHQSTFITRSNSADNTHIYLSQTDSYTHTEPRSQKASPSYQPTLTSHSLPNKDASSHHFPDPVHHSTSNSQPPTLTRVHSMSVEISNNRKRPPQKSYINKNSYNTEL